MTKDLMKDIATESAKASPPVAVVTASATQGWTMNNTLTALTICYVVLQIGWLVWRWHKAASGDEVKGE